MCATAGGYNRETLEVRYRGKNIHEVLQMTIEDARSFFAPVPMLADKLQTLLDVGLGYIQLGQNATTLSGGEAQRVKLARGTRQARHRAHAVTSSMNPHRPALPRRGAAADRGCIACATRATRVVVIEHNLDVVKTADWIIDLGPGVARMVATSLPRARPRPSRRRKPRLPGSSSSHYWPRLSSRTNSAGPA